MISDPIIFSLFIAPFYSIAAPILAFIVCSRSARLRAGHVGLGVAGAVMSFIFFELRPSWIFLFRIKPESLDAGWMLFALTLVESAWVVLSHQAPRYILLRSLAGKASDDGPGLAYGIGAGGYTCLFYAVGGWRQFYEVLRTHNVEALMAWILQPRHDYLFDYYFWSGIPIATKGAANLLLEIALGALACRACREKKYTLLGLGLIIDFAWRVPLAALQSYQRSFPPTLYYEGLGLAFMLGFIAQPYITRRWPNALAFRATSDGQERGLFAIWRDQGPDRKVDIFSKD